VLFDGPVYRAIKHTQHGFQNQPVNPMYMEVIGAFRIPCKTDKISVLTNVGYFDVEPSRTKNKQEDLEDNTYFVNTWCG